VRALLEDLVKAEPGAAQPILQTKINKKAMVRMDSCVGSTRNLQHHLQKQGGNYQFLEELCGNQQGGNYTLKSTRTQDQVIKLAGHVKEGFGERLLRWQKDNNVFEIAPCTIMASEHFAVHVDYGVGLGPLRALQYGLCQGIQKLAKLTREDLQQFKDQILRDTFQGSADGEEALKHINIDFFAAVLDLFKEYAQKLQANSPAHRQHTRLSELNGFKKLKDYMLALGDNSPELIRSATTIPQLIGLLPSDFWQEAWSNDAFGTNGEREEYTSYYE